MSGWTLEIVTGRWILYRLPGESAWPPEALQSSWAFLARTPEEVSLLLPEDLPAPQGGRAEGPWRALRVAGTLDFALVGVLAELSRALAAAGVPILAVSTYDTDYLFVPADRFSEAIAALQAAGHRVMGRLR